MHNTMHTSRMTYIHTFCMDATRSTRVQYELVCIVYNNIRVYYIPCIRARTCTLIIRARRVLLLIAYYQLVCILLEYQLVCSMHSIHTLVVLHAQLLQYKKCVVCTLYPKYQLVLCIICIQYTYAHTMHTTLESSMQSIMHTTQYESTNTTLQSMHNRASTQQ